jgi:glycosyltransferase involved in cell wall biosynthesis
MHILVLNQFYWPSVAATAQLSADLCAALVQAGHSVTALASQGDYVGGADRLPAHAEHDGVQIRRLPATSFGKNPIDLPVLRKAGSVPGRLADYASFYGLATAATLAAKADVYLCLSTPPLIALAALQAARLRKGARFVYWCQDVYPDMAVALGWLQAESPAARALGLASRRILKGADKVVAIGDRMAAVLAERGAHDPVVIHNWSDGTAIDPALAPTKADNRYRKLAGASPEDVLVVYAGNMGLAHDFSGLLHLLGAVGDTPAAARLRFLFVGEGARKADLEAAMAKAPNLRATFLPYQPREALPEMLCAADVHVVTMADEAAGLMVPSKLYGALAAGRAVLLAGPGGTEADDILRNLSCGVRVNAADGAGLTQALVALVADDDGRARMGQRAREGFMATFDRQNACDRFVAEVERLHAP